MTPLEKVDAALEIALERSQKCPDFDIYQSIVLQLEYMKRVLEGSEGHSRMKDIIIGLYALREFEESDPEFAEALHHASYIADRIARGLKID